MVSIKMNVEVLVMVTQELKVNVLVTEALDLPEGGGPDYGFPRARIGGYGYIYTKDESGDPH